MTDTINMTEEITQRIEASLDGIRPYLEADEET